MTEIIVAKIRNLISSPFEISRPPPEVTRAERRRSTLDAGKYLESHAIEAGATAKLTIKGSLTRGRAHAVVRRGVAVSFDFEDKPRSIIIAFTVSLE